MATVSVGSSVTNVLGFLSVLDALKTATVSVSQAGALSFELGDDVYTLSGTGLTASGGKLTGGIITGFASSGATGFTVDGISVSKAQLDSAFAVGAPSNFIEALLASLEYTITGNGQNNTATGEDLVGAVTWTLGAGDDTVVGDKGVDVMNGEGGADRLTGDAGNDTLNGGEDDDDLFGGVGNDVLNGGNGNDVLNGGISTTDGANILNGEGGNDFFEISGSGSDVIVGGAGTDTVEVLTSRSIALANLSEVEALTTERDVTLVGLTTGDTVDLSSSVVAGITLEGVSSFNWGGGADKVTGLGTADTHVGGTGTDSIDGAGGNDLLSGGAGADTLLGGADNDILRGDSGWDDLFGGNGADTLDGGTGENDIDGGAGNDTILVKSSSSRGDIIGGADTDTVSVQVSRTIYRADFSTVESIVATSGKSVTFQGTGNGETVDLSAGASSGLGFTLTNITNFKWGAGADDITGYDTDDRHNGGDGDDSIDGGAGKDVLRGGAGQDELTGGADADVFLFVGVFELGSTTSTRDSITDFTAGDKINLDALNLTWTSNAEFAETSARQVRYDATTDRLLIDTDRDAGSEYQIQFSNLTIGEGDLIL